MIEKNLTGKKMYIVYDWEHNIHTQTDDYDEALRDYNKLKQSYIDSFDGEYTGDENVILAEIIKDFYSAPIEEKDENGDNYWDFYEDTYKEKYK